MEEHAILVPPYENIEVTQRYGYIYDFCIPLFHFEIESTSGAKRGIVESSIIEDHNSSVNKECSVKDELIYESLCDSQELHEHTYGNIHSSLKEPLSGLGDQLLVTEERLLQALSLNNNSHKLIENIIEKGHKGFVERVPSFKLCIIKRELENMKVYYLQLFMDRDLALKFAEDRATKVENLHMSLGG